MLKTSLETIKPLVNILSDGKFHSDSELGKYFNLTRDGIWKLIEQLDKYGIEIETKNNCSCRIPRGLELLDEKIIEKYIALKYRHHIKNMVIFDELPSTNTYLTEQTKNKDNKITICLAESQTQGKGRLGRHWISPYAKNIYLSFLCKALKNHETLSGLSLVMAVTVAAALKLYGLNNEVYLKWPNDVIWKQRKLAGILIEFSAKSHQLYNAVIGVGINVDMPQKQGQKIEQPWCDIAQITNEIPQRNKLTGILLDQLLTAADLYQEQGLPAFIEQWKQLDICYKKPVEIITANETIAGIGQGIDDKGYFVLKTAAGKKLTFAAGEVSLRF